MKVLKGCLKLEELDVSRCSGLTDDSFKVLSEEPNSFPNLRVLDVSGCNKLTEKVFEHLSNNNHLVYQLKELNLERTSASNILSSSPTTRNNICQLKGLRQLCFAVHSVNSDSLKMELIQGLKNLEGFHVS